MKVRAFLALAILAATQAVAVAEDSAAPHALVKIKVLEVDFTKLRKLGVDLRTTQGTVAFDPVEELRKLRICHANDPVRGLLHACERQQLAKVLAEPNLSVLLDQPAHFTSGGEFPVPTGPDGKEVTWRRYGTEAKATARARGEDQVEITFKVRLSEIETAHQISVGDKKVPGVTKFEVGTTCQLRWDDTLSLGSMVQKTADNHEVMRIVLMTPSRLETATANRAPIQPQLK